jgi:hypothetical protein
MEIEVFSHEKTTKYHNANNSILGWLFHYLAINVL